MEAIVTFITPGDVAYADIHEFPEMPRIGEAINIADLSHEWWRVMDVIYTLRQPHHEDGPVVALVVEPIESLHVAIRKKTETRDG